MFYRKVVSEFFAPDPLLVAGHHKYTEIELCQLLVQCKSGTPEALYCVCKSILVGLLPHKQFLIDYVMYVSFCEVVIKSFPYDVIIQYTSIL